MSYKSGITSFAGGASTHTPKGLRLEVACDIIISIGFEVQWKPFDEDLEITFGAMVDSGLTLKLAIC